MVSVIFLALITVAVVAATFAPLFDNFVDMGLQVLHRSELLQFSVEIVVIKHCRKVFQQLRTARGA